MHTAEGICTTPPAGRPPGPPGTPPPQAAAVERLKAERVQEKLAALPGWRLSSDEEAITRAFHFDSVGPPLVFAALVGALAAEVGHYPAQTIVRQTVHCHLTTREVGGVTEKDLELARRISLLG